MAELHSIVESCDSVLSRELCFVKNLDVNAVSFVNDTSSILSCSVNGTSYSPLLRVCLVEGSSGVFVYVVYLNSFNHLKIALGDISSFTIS